MPDIDHRPEDHSTEVYATGDGYRSTAGSNYGDWRPASPPKPHGYDFDSRFEPPNLVDPDYSRLRHEHARDLDDHYPHWQQQRYERFAEDFGSWREQQRAEERSQHGDTDTAGRD